MALPIDIPANRATKQPQPPPFEEGGSFYFLWFNLNVSATVFMYKADNDDPGDGFTEFDSGNHPGGTFVVDSAHAAQDGTDIYVIHGGVSGIEFSIFSTSSDTWTVVAEEIIDTGAGYVAFNWIDYRGDGDILVAYQGDTEADMGNPYDRCYIGRREGTSWTVDIRPDDLGKITKDIQLSAAKIGDQIDDRFHVIYAILDDSDLFVSTYLSDNSFDVSGQDINITTGVQVNNLHAISDIISFDDGGTTKIRGLFLDLATSDLNAYKFDDDDVPTINNEFDINSSGSVSRATLTLDGTTQHSLFVRAVNAITHNETGEGDDTWGSDTTELSGLTTVVITAANVYSRGGDIKLGYSYLDGGQERFNERTLSSAPDVSDLDAANHWPFTPPLFSYLDIIGY